MPANHVPAAEPSPRQATARFGEIRVLEIGDRWLFAEAMPANTLLLWTGIRPLPATEGRMNFGLRAARLLLAALRRGGFDLIVCHVPNYHPLGWRWIGRLISLYVILFPLHVLRTSGVLFLKLPTRTPIAVVDTEDHTAVNRHNFFLFPKCRAFFKRELPADHWKVFLKTAHPNLPTPRLRRRRFYREAVEKLRPISLGISEAKLARVPAAAEEKTVDVFFAGSTANSLVRARGMEQLLALRREGYVVDIADAKMTLEEYFARCARAWLTWSPEGYGWECFRHYEAAACRSVPVINQPSIYRYRPLLNGVHCVHYDVEEDGLRKAVIEALQDKPRLAAMAEAAREHVLRHHAQRRLCDYILETSLGRSGDPLQQGRAVG
ncbi:MAG: glycosyltransferase [Pseudomonadota bacterium]|nr:glycosyltransferase [Pseudomonadota bacterium]